MKNVVKVPGKIRDCKNFHFEKNIYQCVNTFLYFKYWAAELFVKKFVLIFFSFWSSYEQQNCLMFVFIAFEKRMCVEKYVCK